jgi:hypothetical protein
MNNPPHLLLTGVLFHHPVPPVNKTVNSSKETYYVSKETYYNYKLLTLTSPSPPLFLLSQVGGEFFETHRFGWCIDNKYDLFRVFGCEVSALGFGLQGLGF